MRPQCSHRHVFTMQALHFLFRKHTVHIPFSILTRLPVMYVCLLLHGLYRHVCVMPLVCTHPFRQEKKEVSIADLLEGKGTPLLSPLARLLVRDEGFNSSCPEENGFFVHSGFCKGFFTNGMSQMTELNVIHR